MIDPRVLDRYQTQVRNSICLAAKPEQTVAGLRTAMDYLRGCLGSNYAQLNGQPMNHHVKLIQTFTYNNQRVYLFDGIWTIDQARPYGSCPFLAEMSKDENLKTLLVPKELMIHFKGSIYKWEPSEQILLGEEPCLVLITPESK